MGLTKNYLIFCNKIIIALCLFAIGLTLLDFFIWFYDFKILHSLFSTSSIIIPIADLFSILSASALLLNRALIFEQDIYFKKWSMTICLLIILVNLFFLINTMTGEKFLQINLPIMTALNFILLSISILLVGKSRYIWVSQALVIFICLNALLSFLSSILEADVSYKVVFFSQMRTFTTLNLFILSTAVMFLNPNRGVLSILISPTPSGTLLRRVPLIAFLASSILVYLSNYGEKIGLYDDAFGDTLSLTLGFLILIIIIWISTTFLRREEHKRTEIELALNESEILFNQFAENSDEVFWKVTADMKQLVYVSSAFEKIWQYSKSELYENPNLWFEAIVPEDKPNVIEAYHSHSNDKKVLDLIYRIQRKDGTIRYIYDRGFYLKDENDNIINILGIATDVTTSQLAKQRIEAQQDIVLMLSSEENPEKIATKILMIFCTKLDWDFAQIWVKHRNQNVLKSIGKYSKFGEDNALPDALPLDAELNEYHEILKTYENKRVIWKTDASKPLMQIFQQKNKVNIHTFVTIPVMFRGSLFSIVSIASQYIIEKDSNLTKLISLIGSQVGEYLNQKNNEKEIYQDVLTGFITRFALEESLNKKMAKENYIAIIVFDLDKFKVINEAIGYDSGDILLDAVAKRIIKLNLPKKDMIARLSADKFSIVPHHVDNVNQVVNYIYQIFSIFKEPFYINNKEFLISSCVGVSFYPKDGKNSKELIKKANIALESAKKEGKNNFQFFSQESLANSSHLLLLENELRQAINKNQLVLHYQPKISLATGKIMGVEALLRWQHPEKGLLHPSSFMEIAEQHDLVTQLTEWIISEVFNQIANGNLMTTVAINISAHHFKSQYNLAGYLKQMLQGFRISPKLIELEITETVLMELNQAFFATLSDLRNQGFSLTIDDFGARFSSLNYIKTIAADKIKIDKMFIEHLPYDISNASIIKAILALFHTLGIKVVCEGVETLEQVKFLVNEGCDEVQGFYFYQPQTLAELNELIRKDIRCDIPKKTV